MNAQEIDLSSIMTAEGIRKIENHGAGVICVELSDYRLGAGDTLGKALTRARRPNAVKSI